MTSSGTSTSWSLRFASNRLGETMRGRAFALVALPLALVVTMGPTLRNAHGFVQAAAVARDQNPKYKPGDTVVVKTKAARLQLGGRTLALVLQGTALKVMEVSGDWVGVRVLIDGKLRAGWLPAEQVEPLPPGSARIEEKKDMTPGAPHGEVTRDSGKMALRERPRRHGEEKGDAQATASATRRPNTQPATPKSAENPSPNSAADRSAAAGRALASAASPQAPSSRAEANGVASAPARSAATVPPTSANKTAAPSGLDVDIQLVLARTIDQIERLDRSKRIGQLTLAGDQFSDRSLKSLDGLYIRKLSIEATSLTNSCMKYIPHIRGLRFLRLWSPRFTDGVLRHLGAFKELEVLDLDGSAVSGSRLDELAGLPKLQMLVLGALATDATLEKLVALPALTQLDLRACNRLTEASFTILAKLTKLKQLWLPTPIARKGRGALRKQLPGCRIQ